MPSKVQFSLNLYIALWDMFSVANKNKIKEQNMENIGLIILRLMVHIDY